MHRAVVLALVMIGCAATSAPRSRGEPTDSQYASVGGSCPRAKVKVLGCTQDRYFGGVCLIDVCGDKAYYSEEQPGRWLRVETWLDMLRRGVALLARTCQSTYQRDVGIGPKISVHCTDGPDYSLTCKAATADWCSKHVTYHVVPCKHAIAVCRGKHCRYMDGECDNRMTVPPSMEWVQDPAGQSSGGRREVRW